MDERELKNDGEVLYINSGNEEAIRSAQRFLNENGYTDGYGRKLSEDGIFGKNTYNAVIKYQQDNNLYVDGKIGDKTWGSMWDKDAENKAKKEAEKAESVPKAEEPKNYEKPKVTQSNTTSSSKEREIGFIAPFFYHHFNAVPTEESEAIKEERERQENMDEFIKNNGWNAWYTSGMYQ